MRATFGFAGFVLLASACAEQPEPASAPAPRVAVGRPPPSPLPNVAAQVAETPAQVAEPEAMLGVVDRGIFSDLDARVQLPPPDAKASLSLVIDDRHSLLVVYADGWPHKVYPLGGSAVVAIRGEKLGLRPGDRDELGGRLSRLAARHLGPGEVAPPGDADDDGIPDPLDLLIGAHKAALDGASYDDAYFSLSYPGGDPPRNKGACVDVIVRSARNAGQDLQPLVINDERAAASAYGIQRPDTSIDHRRVRNVVVYFQRHWQARSASIGDPRDPLRPGDVVFLDTISGRPGPDHVGVVTQTQGESGYPLVINLWTFGYQTQAMDLLGFVPVTHRFRFPSRGSTPAR